MKKKEKKEQTDDSDQNPYKNHFFHLFSFSPKRVGAITFAVPGGKRITSQGETSLCGAKLHVARTGNTSLPRLGVPAIFPALGNGSFDRLYCVDSNVDKEGGKNHHYSANGFQNSVRNQKNKNQL